MHFAMQENVRKPIQPCRQHLQKWKGGKTCHPLLAAKRSALLLAIDQYAHVCLKLP